MKYLEAQREAGKAAKPSIVGEHKMRGGLDPKDPMSLVSSPHVSTRDARAKAQGQNKDKDKAPTLES